MQLQLQWQEGRKVTLINVQFVEVVPSQSVSCLAQAEFAKKLSRFQSSRLWRGKGLGK